MTEALRKSCLLYNVLLFAYPRDFRHRLPNSMSRWPSECLRDRYDTQFCCITADSMDSTWAI